MVLSVVLNMVIVKMYGLVVGFGSFHGIELFEIAVPIRLERGRGCTCNVGGGDLPLKRHRELAGGHSEEDESRETGLDWIAAWVLYETLGGKPGLISETSKFVSDLLIAGNEKVDRNEFTPSPRQESEC
jgi:hypothetical protein